MTLRGFSKKVRVSAAHLSDIEHNRRRPSEALLRRIASQLRKVGTTFDALEQHVTGLDAATRDWVPTTPGARTLPNGRGIGSGPREILPALEMIVRRRTTRVGRHDEGTEPEVLECEAGR